MRSLLDVNVLIALLDADHAQHEHAAQWFARHAESGWASCPITENGCLRIMSNPRYPAPVPVSVVASLLREATATRFHEFWPDDASALDEGIIDLTRVHGPRQLTDVYLLAVAVRRGGRLVTFDSGVSSNAVVGAQSGNLLKL
jgi:toxin-antitoxin system PIN domain toxin